tara:strand:- start:1236 stop:1346 length:111 start_codon:yes stop_codon:yes gene_type:complete
LLEEVAEAINLVELVEQVALEVEELEIQVQMNVEME